MYHFERELFDEIIPDELWKRDNYNYEVSTDDESKPLRENNAKTYKHVPHKDRPQHAVEKRNARERRRVQAVNNAFVKLRNVIPIQNSRGKRVSKVKTLLHAIEYIRALDQLLRDYEPFPDYYSMERTPYQIYS